MTAIDQARVLILATDGYERAELVQPRDDLRRRGAEVRVAAPRSGRIRSWDKTDWGDEADVDLTVADVAIDDFDALILPGGQINPDTLRQDRDAVKLVADFVASGKPVAAICHGPWMLVEADVLRGRTVTSYPSIATDVKNAGATWIDEEVVTDQGIVTSRNPGDLPAFIDKLVEEIGEGRHAR
ncbi:protease [Tistrella bauzanensis]|uniref:Protease n=1 Tax=Tistrella bauzanensis TaxID=657419 RepID=A0ABQ1I7U4_9PROT|nr:type 1 glutamine amidotransferase domain-containing protein [Tistrella bauzanensis]GGB25496.1 protease [Tistrella bauzanensis]